MQEDELIDSWSEFRGVWCEFLACYSNWTIRSYFWRRDQFKFIINYYKLFDRILIVGALLPLLLGSANTIFWVELDISGWANLDLCTVPEITIKNNYRCEYYYFIVVCWNLDNLVTNQFDRELRTSKMKATVCLIVCKYKLHVRIIFEKRVRFFFSCKLRSCGKWWTLVSTEALACGRACGFKPVVVPWLVLWFDFYMRSLC